MLLIIKGSLGWERRSMMISKDCRRRAEEARQRARQAKHHDRDTWLQIAEKYDRLADDLDQRDTRAVLKQRAPQLAASRNAELIA